ncbi:hypothetical protein E4631_16000 [Hymenobacter sp. UV11]|uniref:hypothetical protein n=1 Tax=Hymenobacter sp. UV11 TaxID=1849735 RepID=UPI00105FF318|nr:hypothetical protein [Hymenobacter sp. UV11]TDN37837.1 hypothetical protein A8B98_00840 [Hymenobacter sp. UV11]TFZ65047.1 hypothetical protein E4631_16000 [Hymenobacter sp. UV11]
MKYFSLPPNLPGQVLAAARHTGLRAWQKGRLFRQLAQRTLDSVQEVLRAEIQSGHARLVADFLADKALPAARALLLERMAARLLLRIGLRGVFMTNIASWVLPFVLEKLFQAARTSGLLARLEANPTVTDALSRLDELRQAASRLIFPDGATEARVLTDEEAAALLQQPARQLPAHHEPPVAVD